MVCKKSLYCWKNGPCASFQTRKKIWEDNIKFRESLRNVNQSDHYWSFQISKNLCLCQDNEVFCKKPFSTYSNSMYNLHESDCTSVAHDYNGLEYRNCLVHCPLQNYSKDIKNESNINTIELPIPIEKPDNSRCAPNQCQCVQKLNSKKLESCSKYKDILLDSTLKTNMKKKFVSQSNLNSADNFKNSKSMLKKSLNLSCENVSRTSNNKCDALKSIKKAPSQLNLQKNKETDKPGSAIKEKKFKCKNVKEINQKKFIQNEKLNNCNAPLSQTTKKILKENKKAPFLPYGCNNKSNDIGAKKTHNVLASKLEVYPNALSAQQQKQNFILKNMECEKELQKKCFSDKFKKEKINHSSLWSREFTGKENKVVQQKNLKKNLPILCRNPKKLCAVDYEVKSSIKTNQKPQIYFY